MYTLFTTTLVIVINKAHIKIILLMALLYSNYYYIGPIPIFFMTIKYNSIAFLGCVVDNMADYVSYGYVYSITSERNLHVIFGRL